MAFAGAAPDEHAADALLQKIVCLGFDDSQMQGTVRMKRGMDSGGEAMEWGWVQHKIRNQLRRRDGV